MKAALQGWTAEQNLWWARYAAGAGSLPPDQAEEMRASFDAFVRATHGLRLGAPPASLLPFAGAGKQTLIDIQQILRRPAFPQDTVAQRAACTVDSPARKPQGALLQELRSCTTYERAKVVGWRLIEGAAGGMRSRVEFDRFFACLDEGVTKGTFQDADALLLVRIGVEATCVANLAGSLEAMALWYQNLCDDVDPRLARILFTASPPGVAPPEELVRASELCMELRAHVDLRKFLLVMGRERRSLPAILTELAQRSAESYSVRYPERPLEGVIAAFSERQTDAEPTPSLPKLLIDRLATVYRRINDLTEEVQGLGRDALTARVGDIRTRAARQGGIAPADQIPLLALLREGVRRCFHQRPYNTQMLALLALLEPPSAENPHGRIAQMYTGEGKSTVVALLAAYHAVAGLNVDIVSSARPLSVRDCDKYTVFFELLGLNASHVCADRPTEENFAGQIIYGTSADFEWSLLRDNLYGTRLFLPRRSDVCIVDEVDNLFIDQSINNAIVGVRGKDPFAWVVAPIFAFVQEKMASGEPLDAAAAKQTLIANRGGDISLVAGLSDIQVSRWLESCLMALQIYVEKRHYVLKGGEVVLMDDRNTGQLLENQRLRHRVHQFLEQKHGLTVHDENPIGGEMSHPMFFNRYRTVVGLTGTIGSSAERNEIAHVYGVGAFYVPPHLPKQGDEAKTYLFDSPEAHDAAILQHVKDMVATNRPCLVLTDSVLSSEHVSELLVDVPHQVYNAVQDDDEAAIIARAGRPGVVTVATNIAGRGTDIILSAKSFPGGLYVVLTFYPESIRTQVQGLGRARRQGQPGGGVVLVFDADGAGTAKELAARRKKTVDESSAQRMRAAEHAKRCSIVQDEFFGRLRAWHDSIDGVLYSNLSRWLHEHLAELQNLPEDTQQPRSMMRQKVRYLAREVVSPDLENDHFVPFLREFREVLNEEILENWGTLYTAMVDNDGSPGVAIAKDSPQYATLARLLDEPKVAFARELENLIGLSRQPHELREFSTPQEAVGYTGRARVHGTSNGKTWIYEGALESGMMHGAGDLRFGDGAHYEGEFANNMIDGRGVYAWPDGSRWDGPFKAGRRAGQGTFTWPNGDTMPWQDNLPAGASFGSTIQMPNEHGWSPLLDAIRRGDVPNVEFIVGHASVLSRPVPGAVMSAQIAAALTGNPSLLALVPGGWSDGDPFALHAYCQRGSSEATRRLARRGDFNQVDPFGKRPLERAVASGDEATVRRVLEVDVSHESRNAALLEACRISSWKMVQRLLTAGADPLWLGPNGRAALHEAAYSDHAEIVQNLLQAAPAALGVYTAEGLSSMAVAATAGAVSALKALVTADGNRDALYDVTGDAERSNLAHLAARHGRGEVLQWLHTNRPQLFDIRDGAGMLPWEVASTSELAEQCRGWTLSAVKSSSRVSEEVRQRLLAGAPLDFVDIAVQWPRKFDFSPDGRWLAVAEERSSRRLQATLWNLKTKTKTPIDLGRRPDEPFGQRRFSADGRYFALWNSEGYIPGYSGVFRLSENGGVTRLQAVGLEGGAGLISDDKAKFYGNLFVTVGPHGHTTFSKVDNTHVRHLRTEASKNIYVAEDGSCAVGVYDNDAGEREVRLLSFAPHVKDAVWDVSAGNVAISPDGNYVAMEDDGSIFVASTRQPHDVQCIHESIVGSKERPDLQFSPDGRRLLLRTSETLRVWTLNGTSGSSTQFHALSNTKFRWVAGGSHLLVWAHDEASFIDQQGTVRQITGKIAAVSPDGSRLAVEKDGGWDVWDLLAGTSKVLAPGITDKWGAAVEFMADARFMLLTTNEKLALVDAETMREKTLHKQINPRGYLAIKATPGPTSSKIMVFDRGYEHTQGSWVFDFEDPPVQSGGAQSWGQWLKGSMGW